jgi:hypothetical protein
MFGEKTARRQQEIKPPGGGDAASVKLAVS